MVQGSKQYLEVDFYGSTAIDSQWGTFGTGANFNNGFAAGEAVYGVENATPDWRGVEIVDDGFGLAAAMKRSENAVKANIALQRPGEVIGVDATGSINPVAAPWDKRTAYAGSVVNWVLGAALNRDHPDQTDKLRSYTMRWTTPGVSSETFGGCKCSSLTIEASEDTGLISFTSEWTAGSYKSENAVGTTPVFPQQMLETSGLTGGSPATGWTFSRAYLLLGGTAVATIRSLSITHNNNLDPSSPRVKTEFVSSLTVNTFSVLDLREQAPSVSGSFVVDYLDQTYTTAMLADTDLEIVILARHPQSNVFGVVSMDQGGPIAAPWTLTATDVALTLEADVGSMNGTGGFTTAAVFGLEDGGVVMVEDTSTGDVLTYTRDIAIVNAESTITAGVVTLETGVADIFWTPQGLTFPSSTAGDFIVYDQALGIRVGAVKLDSATQEGGAADIIGQNVSFTATQTDVSIPPITWACGSEGNDFA